MIVSVVIPTHNGKRFLSRCLDALRGTQLPKGVELEVIVVDNGSRDGTEVFLQGYPWVKTLVFSEGLGFARANNAARPEARGDVVCFINNDTAVEPDWLLRPLEILGEDPTVAAVGAKLLYMHHFVRASIELPPACEVFVAADVFGGALDSKIHFSSRRRDQIGDVRGFWLRNGDHVYLPKRLEGLDPAPERQPLLRCLGWRGTQQMPAVSWRWSPTEPPRVLTRLPGVVVLPELDQVEAEVRLIQNAGSFLTTQWEGGDAGGGEEDDGTRFHREEVTPSLCGGALFVRRSDLDAVGWFPENYRMYYEDTDLCLQLQGRGKRLVYCPSSRVNHYHTGTSREWSPFFIENVTRSAALFVIRNAPRPVLEARLRQLAVQVVRNLQTAVAGRMLPHRAWDRLPELRGAVLAVPEALKASVTRLQTAAPPAVELGRKPYAVQKEKR